ncbi:MAG: leucine-rich repeat domain-containing protein [Prevotella sp.]|nr:leucine-rich repeat domain-containing protein [Prevotella sp.]
MAKKITICLLLMLLTSIGAMADYEYYPDQDCWVDENGVIYKFVDGVMNLYSYNKPATGDYGTATVPGAPEWDYDKDYDLEILDYFEDEGYVVTQIYRQAFNGITNIKSLTIPATIEKIGTSAFANCTGIEKITCYAKTPPDISAGSCFGMASNGSSAYKATVYVPYGCKDAYLNDRPNTANSGWGYYATMGFFTFEELEEGDIGTVTKGVLTVDPETNSRIKGQLESITISYEGGVALSDASLQVEVNDSEGEVAAILKPAAAANQDGSYTLYMYDVTGTTITPLTKFDDFKLTIPSGSFNLGEDKMTINVKTSLNYTVEDDAVYTITLDPENGYISNETLEYFTVSCEDGLKELKYFDWDHINVYDTNSNIFTFVTKDGDVEDTETVVTFVFDTPISTPGTYKFTFPEGTFRVGPNNQWSGAIDVTYTVSDDVVETEGKWSYYPSDTTAITSLKEIQIQYSTGLVIAEGKEDGITLTGSNGNIFTSNDFTIETITNGITITLSEEIVETGTYTLSAPAGTFLLGQTKQESGDFSVSFVVASYTLSFDPEDGTTLLPLDAFTVTCQAGLDPVLDDQDEMGVLNVNRDGELIAVAVPDQKNPITDEDGNIISYSFTVMSKDNRSQAYPIDVNGTYVIEMGRGYFQLGPEKVLNDLTTCTYYIVDGAGIKDIEVDTTDSSSNEYFNLSGQRVTTPKAGGVYIIGGKKVVVK